MRKQWKLWQTLFSWSPKSLWIVTAAMKLKDACSLKEKQWQSYTVLKSRDITLPRNSICSKFWFSSSHVWMSELDSKEGWAPNIDAFKLWCWRTWEILGLQGIKPVNPKGKQSWISIRRTDAKTEAPILWPSAAKSQLIGKDLSWERLKAGREGDNREWDDCMASQTHWTWVGASPRS